MGRVQKQEEADQEVKRAGNGLRYRVRPTHGGEEERLRGREGKTASPVARGP